MDEAVAGGIWGWLLRRARSGNRRMVRLVGLLGKAWRFFPASFRRRVTRVVRVAQLNRRLAPAILSPFIFAATARLGLWFLLAAMPVVALWTYDVAFRRLSIRRQTIVAGLFMAVLIGPEILRLFAPETFYYWGGVSGLTFGIGLWGLIVTCLTIGLTVAFSWAVPSRVGTAVVGGLLGALYALTAYIGLLPDDSVVDLPAALLRVPGVWGAVLDLVVFTLAGAAVLVRARRLHAPERLHRPLRRVVRLAGAAAAILPFVFWYSNAATSLDSLEARYYERRSDFEKGLLPQTHPAVLTPLELVRAYRPLLVLHAREHWLPRPVGPYLREASIWRLKRQSDATYKLVAPVAFPRGELPRRCTPPTKASENPAPAPICYALVGTCTDVSLACARGGAKPWDEGSMPRGHVYGRVVLWETPPGDGSPHFLRGPLPYPNLHAVAQYWLFYRNNRWEAQTGLGALAQRHQSDWEQITIGFSPTEPLFIAYSSHCGGHWVEWKDAWTERMADGSVRPVAWVARGSHANYPDPAPRQPDFLSCRTTDRTESQHAQARRRALALFALPIYGANVRETLPHALIGDGAVIQDPHAQLIDAHSEPFSYPGIWAAYGGLVIRNEWREATLPPDSRPKDRPSRRGDKASGPDTPSCKNVWKDPLAVIFCGPYWHPDSRCTPALERRRQAIKSGCI